MLDQATEPQPPGATTMLGARDLASRASTLATLVRGAEAAQACACVGEILTVDARPENRTSSSGLFLVHNEAHISESLNSRLEHRIDSLGHPGRD